MGPWEEVNQLRLHVFSFHFHTLASFYRPQCYSLWKASVPWPRFKRAGLTTVVWCSLHYSLWYKSVFLRNVLVKKESVFDEVDMQNKVNPRLVLQSILGYHYKVDKTYAFSSRYKSRKVWPRQWVKFWGRKCLQCCECTKRIMKGRNPTKTFEKIIFGVWSR